MAYSVRHITSFRYEPAVRESVMEVRMQPRTDFRQRCLSFTLDVQPRATMMVYRDFYGNAVHHFDIPQKHALIEVTAQAIVDVLPAQDFAQGMPAIGAIWTSAWRKPIIGKCCCRASTLLLLPCWKSWRESWNCSG